MEDGTSHQPKDDDHGDGNPQYDAQIEGQPQGQAPAAEHRPDAVAHRGHGQEPRERWGRHGVAEPRVRPLGPPHAPCEHGYERGSTEGYDDPEQVSPQVEGEDACQDQVGQRRQQDIPPRPCRVGGVQALCQVVGVAELVDRALLRSPMRNALVL